MSSLNNRKKIEIKNPETIFAARATTGYKGKLEFITCDYLTNIVLSDFKQEGNIVMPFSIDTKGNAKYEAGSFRKYRIHREGDKVYII